MMERSYDADAFRKGASLYPEGFEDDFDYEGWLADRNNIMYVCGDNVGLATYEYPGVYNAHWFFTVRGRGAIALAREMYDQLFNHDGAEMVRGLTPVHLRGARWLAKQLGFISLGIVDDDDPHELMCLSKADFNRQDR